MRLELVESPTSDGLVLHGLVYVPDAPYSPTEALEATGSIKPPALLFVHGVFHNFYETPLRRIAQSVAERGYTCLVTNTRGHDWVASGNRRIRYVGSAFEVMDDAIADLDGAIDTLGRLGHDQVILVGHSFGAVKTLYYQSKRAHPAVVGLVLCSPPDLSHSQLSKMPGFTDVLDAAARAAEQGHGDQFLPGKIHIPGFFSVRTLLDKYGPQDKGNALQYVEKIRCPVLLTCGTKDVVLPFAEEIREGTERLGWEHFFIEGGEHSYAGLEDVAAERIVRWLGNLRGMHCERETQPG